MPIKGPRSALSQFLEEENIKVDSTTNQSEQTQKRSRVNSTEQRVIKPKKRIRHTQPKEIINYSDQEDEKMIKYFNIHSEIENHVFEDDSEIEGYCKFLYQTGLMTQKIFNRIADQSKNTLSMFDCSMIQDFSRIQNLEYLKLNYCGQLKDFEMDLILQNNPNLRVLHITGAFLLEKINLSKHEKLEDLNVKNCSRLQNDFIEQLDKNKMLQSLDISYCFGINKEAVLQVNIKKLHLNRVGISKKFFKLLDQSQIEELAISFCPILFNNKKNRLHFKKFKSLRKLHIDGISEIKKIKTTTLEECKASSCFSLSLPVENKNIKILDFSQNDFSTDDLSKIFLFEKLEFLNVSFNSNVSNQFIIDCVQKFKNLKEIIVFGCFNLTEELGQLAWNIKENIRIVGNHAETKFLLDN